MTYFLALDVGGTKADYLLADEVHVLARVRSGTIKRMRVDAETAAVRLQGALDELSRQAGVALTQITRTCVGTAGESVPLVTDWLRREIGARVSGELLLLGDVEVALDAAFAGGSGVLVLAGTGSNVAGRGRDGSMFHAGGWGPMLADQGSGHRLGYQALRRAMLAHDEQRPTTLLAAIMEFWSLQSLDELIEYANRVPAPDLSQLTPALVRCAHEGDEIAQEVLRLEGEELAFLVLLVLRRMHAADAEARPGLAFAGSIMENVLPVRETVIARVAAEFPKAAVQAGVVDPVMGALWRARGQRLKTSAS